MSRERTQSVNDAGARQRDPSPSQLFMYIYDFAFSITELFSTLKYTPETLCPATTNVNTKEVIHRHCSTNNTAPRRTFMDQ